MSQKLGTSFEINIFLVQFRVSLEWAPNTYLNANTSSSVVFAGHEDGQSLLLLACLPGSVVCPLLLKMLSRVRLFEIPWTVAYQAPLFMGFSRQEYWSGLPFPSPGDFPTRDQTCVSSIVGIPILATGFFTVSATSPTMLCWKLVSMKQELLNIFPSQWGQHTASNWRTEIFKRWLLSLCQNGMRLRYSSWE